MKKNILIFIFVILISVNLSAKEEYKKPKSSEVVLVFSFNSTPSIDRDFYKKYIPIFSKNKNHNPIDLIHINSQGKYPKEGHYAKVENICSINVKINSRWDVIKLRYFKQLIFGLEELYLIYPLNAQIKLIEGQKYLYLGHFKYKRKSSNDSTIIGIERFDRFDEAKKVVKERYGEDANLIRVPLKELD